MYIIFIYFIYQSNSIISHVSESRLSGAWSVDWRGSAHITTSSLLFSSIIRLSSLLVLLKYLQRCTYLATGLQRTNRLLFLIPNIFSLISPYNKLFLRSLIRYSGICYGQIIDKTDNPTNLVWLKPCLDFIRWNCEILDFH